MGKDVIVFGILASFLLCRIWMIDKNFIIPLLLFQISYEDSKV